MKRTTTAAAALLLALALAGCNNGTASTPYKSCAAARAAGAAPMHRGTPGYNPNLDGDWDGIACETSR